MAQRGLEEFFVPRKRRLPASFKESSAAKDVTELDRPSKKAKKDLTGPCAEQTSHQAQANFPQGRQHVISSLKGLESGHSTKSNSTDAATSRDDSVVPKGPGRKLTKTPRSVQRNLFGDDAADLPAKAAPEPGPSEDGILKKAAPEMSPLKMKESLKSCSSFDQLKERIASFHKANMKLKSFQSENKLSAEVKGEGNKSLEFVVSSPVKTPKKFPQTPSPKKTPAYQRFQHLIMESPSTLALPYKYRFLKEAFHCLDTVSSFLHNRKEVITFKKLKTSVQDMLNRNFTEKQLAQIKTVFPFAYIFRREKDIPNHKVTPNNKNKYQLTLEVNTEYAADMKASATPCSPKARGLYRKLSPSMLLERGRVFHASLLDILLQHHHQFLQSLQPPVAVDPVRVTRWHAEFPLEAVPEIDPAPLPVAPPDAAAGTARDLLERARAVFGKYPKLGQCLAEAEAAAGDGESASSCGSEPQPASSGSATQAAPPSTAAAGLPTGLLARIRAREAARQARQMTRSPEETRRLEALGRLPALARALRAAFVSEGRAALPLTTAVVRLADSGRGQQSEEELAQQVRLLTEEVPAFLQILHLKAGTFVKMNREQDVNQVVKQLEDRLEKLKR